MAPKLYLLAVAASLSLLAACPAVAYSEISATTEFGITVTPDDVYNAIEESSDFWPPVGRHVAGADFPVADAERRRQAAEFIGHVNQTLHDRLFGDDEPAAEDVLAYLQARLRVLGCYRQLREALADDALLIELKDHWEDQNRQLYLVPQPARALLAHDLPNLMGDEMRRLGLPEERIAATLPLWKRLSSCEARRNTTSAGRLMLEYERQVMSGDGEQAEFIRRVVAAADWSLIIKPSDRIATKRDFLRAWDAIEGYRVARR